MGLLDNLLGGGQHQQQLQNFAERYSQGSPHEGYTPQEAQQAYQQVATQLPQDQYVQAAEQAFNRMSPQEREQFARDVHQQAQQQGVQIPGMNPGQYQQYQNSGALAQLTGQLHSLQPGLLGQLFGGNSGGNAGSGGMSPLAKMALGGIAAMAVKNLMAGKL